MNILFQYVPSERASNVLSSVSSDDISDACSTKRALASIGPLLDSTLEAHTHVSTRVKDTVHIRLIANNTFCRLRNIGSG